MSGSHASDDGPSWMSETLRSLTHLCTRHPKMTLFLVLLSCVASVAYTVTHLKFKTDRSDLIDPSTPFQQRWLRYTKSFGESADMVVVVEGDGPETIKQALDNIGEKLKQQPDLFANVLYKIEPGNLRIKGLQYLPPDLLAAGLERLDDYRPVLRGRWDLIRLESLIPLLQYQLQDLNQRSPEEASGLWHHAEILAESLDRFSADKNDFINPWPEIVSVDAKMRDQANQTVYLFNEAGTMGFVMAAPAQKNTGFTGASKAVDRLREVVAETQSQIVGSRISLTGIPVLENDEMRRSQADSIRAELLSFAGVMVLFFIGLRGFAHPLMGMATLAVGMAWSYGFTTLVVGHLNILSIAFASIVIGLGNDFAIHILSRYLDLRHHGRDVRHALVETSTIIGPGIMTGAITTALAFFCASFTSFLGVAELGLIAGGGILLCTVATFTFLPALIAVADRRRTEQAMPVPFQGKLLRTATSQYPGWVLAASVVLFVALGYGSFDWSQGWPKPRLQYDHNLLNLQAEGLESVETQKRVFESSKNSLLYAISLADSAEQARELKAKFEKLPTVQHVEELASRLPLAPPSETKLFVQAFHTYLAKLPEAPPQLDPTIPASVGRLLDQFYTFLRTQDHPSAEKVTASLDRFLNRLDQLDIQSQMMLLGEFQYRLAYSLMAQFQALAAASDPEPVTPEDLPPELLARYVSPQGQWLLQVFPKDQVWDMEPLAQFVNEVRSVDPEITGTPLQNFEAALQIKESYEVCAIYSLVVILLVLLIDFVPKEFVLSSFIPPGIAVAVLASFLAYRKLEIPVLPMVLVYAAGVFLMAAWWHRAGVLDTISAIVPPFLGLLVTFGLLAVLDIPLNPANLIILPLIIGIGVDNGVHVLHDFHGKPHEVYRPSASMVNAITMTSSTSICGFGSMMTSSHRGLYSLGAVLSLGVISCVLMSLVTLPALLAWISRHRKPEEPSGEMASPSTPMTQEDEPRILPMPNATRVA